MDLKNEFQFQFKDCKYCFKPHKLFYYVTKNGARHLCYRCPNKPTKIQKDGRRISLPRVDNLNLKEEFSIEYQKKIAEEKMPKLF